MFKKSEVISVLLSQLNKKLQFLNQNLKSSIISRNSDTKSSAEINLKLAEKWLRLELEN